MQLPLLAAIVVKPRETTRWIIDHRGTRGAVLLVVAAALSSAIKEVDLRAALPALRSLHPAAAAIAAGVFIAVLGVSVLLFYGLAWLAMWSGRFVGGSGDYRAVRTALAWGFAPVIWAALFRIPAIIWWREASAIYRNGGARPMIRVGESLLSGAQFGGPAPFYQFVTLTALEGVVVALYIAVSSNTLAEAHGISAWAGLGNLVMTWMLPLIGVIVIIVASFFSFR